MRSRSADDLRASFIQYFARHKHEILKSSSLVPANDPTLMFTTAGMVQFKDVFRGVESRPYTRATVAQKCLRVSGKQNDIEEVGRTARHHTFFEMLGNFSFGDYFREEAITFAWEFLTEVLKLPKDKLWITVFGGEGDLPPDNEARKLWRDVTAFPEERIIRLGMDDNFWAMGDTGPCGVTSEIFYDTGSGSITMGDFESGRVVEIWNLVFLQYDRQSDGSLTLLPKPCIDTGMGLERLACVVQGQKSNFHTDMFVPLLEHISELAGKRYGRSDSEDDVSMRVIADHARALSFLVADGIQPANEGRGYVMRRIMRRAIRHGKRLGLEEHFLHEVCNVVVQVMSNAYPELNEASVLIGKIAELEETTFRRTLDKGLRLLEEEISRTTVGGVLSGYTIFKLYDTYGFPKDLTRTIAAERGLTIDEEGFAAQMAHQQERSRGSLVGEAAIDDTYKRVRRTLGPIDFVGYASENTPMKEREGKWRRRNTQDGDILEFQTEVRAIIKNGVDVPSASTGAFDVILQPTPFYGESGGQVGDVGKIVDDDGLELDVTDTLKPLEGLTVEHVRIVAGEVRPGKIVWAGYYPAVRQRTRAHHSATHLLQTSLRKVLGEHVKQAGSYVGPERLRFDYTHFEPPTDQQLRAIENDVNVRVDANATVETSVMPFDAAREKGAIALFGEKYGDVVRVLTMGDSIELCGGTHVSNTSEVGLVLITREEAIASGVRRLEAEVAEAAEQTLENTLSNLEKAAALISGKRPDLNNESILQSISKVLNDVAMLSRELRNEGENVEPPTFTALAPRRPAQWDLAEGRRILDLWAGLKRLANTHGDDATSLTQKLSSIDKENLLGIFAQVIASKQNLERKLSDIRSLKLSSQADNLIAQAQDIDSVKLLTSVVAGVDGKALRDLSHQLRSKVSNGVFCLFAKNGGKALLVIAVSKELTPRVSASVLVNKFAPIIGGRGGGNPEFAQAGGDKPEASQEIFIAIEEHLKENMGATLPHMD